MSHRPIERRAPCDDVKCTVFDLVGAYTRQETLLFLVFFNETNEFAFRHAKIYVCQLGFLKGVHVLIVAWGRLSHVLPYWRGSISAWAGIFREKNSRSSLFSIDT